MDNPFAPVYHELSEEQSEAVKTIKNKAMELYEALHIICPSNQDPRCLALGKTNLEQAVMWAVKGITNPPK